MDRHHDSTDQEALWNGPAGQAWVDSQAMLDQVLAPFEALLVAAVKTKSKSRVLDVGCGTGGTTVAMARALGNQGRCTGVDISEPMIAAARARVEPGTSVQFVRANAETHPFPPAEYDLVVSRFGVMFFENPAAAFRNLRRAATNDAELEFVA